MTFGELVAAVGFTARLPDAHVQRVVRHLVDVVLAGVAAGRSVTVPGLGTFRRATRKARRVRHPRTKELMQVDETATVRFSAAKAAKEKMQWEAT